MDSIFLVHGFLGARYSDSRRILERCVSRLARQSGVPGTARVFRFDVSDSPLDGKDSVEREVWKLRRLLVLLLHDPGLEESQPYYDGDQGYEHGDDDVDSSSRRHDASFNQPQPDNNNTILFIAHGLGSWIVKDVLAHPSSRNIANAYARTEVKFIDVDIHKRVQDPYREYLTRNWGIFNFSLSRPPASGTAFDEFLDYLREVDENFDEFAARFGAADGCARHLGHTEKRSQMLYQGQDLAIWVSENRLESPREVCWIVGRNLNVIITTANSHVVTLEAFPASTGKTSIDNPRRDHQQAV